MTKVIDLTYPLGSSVSGASWDPPVKYTPIHTHAEHGRTNAVLEFSIHNGTHVDPPYHFVPEGYTIDQLPLERLMGTAHIVRLKDCLSFGESIDIHHIEQSGLHKSELKDKIILIYTGWAEQYYGTQKYYKEGYSLSTDLANWLVEADIKAVALDHPPEDPEADFYEAPVHRTLLKNNICIIENVANLNQIDEDTFHLYAIPINVEKGCGGPARVFAMG